eukprot:GHVU01198169.1.p5 GENE.GHVU01198169.1~~GHVU01198169.1.p5  ORF type:complete len:100 (+),score=13.75 GHVU01198169.1:528-827(+)
MAHPGGQGDELLFSAEEAEAAANSAENIAEWKFEVEFCVAFQRQLPLQAGLAAGGRGRVPALFWLLWRTERLACGRFDSRSQPRPSRIGTVGEKRGNRV